MNAVIKTSNVVVILHVYCLFVCLNGVLTPHLAIFQLFHGVQFLLGEEAGVPGEKPRPAVGKLAILVN